MEKKTLKQILAFISEAGMLKRLKRSGWNVVGIENPESVAEHSFRCAVIGYALAKMERVPPYQVLLMTLFGDIHEARIGDLHKMAQRYIHIEKGEDHALREQISSLPQSFKTELHTMRSLYRAQKSKESIIARDADILECLLQAKEYYEQGFCEAKKFYQKAPRFLKTKSARALWRKAKTSPLNDWWQTLTEFKR